jgi:hypothetical protein
MRYKFVLSFAVFLMAAALAWGQTGTLFGTITNPAGQPVPNAVVVITNTVTNNSVRVVTAPNGEFKVEVPPGTYKVDVESAGFKHVTVQPIEINEGAGSRLTAALEPGPSTETVQLQAKLVDLQDTPPEISRVYMTRTVRTLPAAFDHNYTNFPNLMPGVTPPQMNFDIIMNPQNSVQWFTNGQPDWANDHTLSGSTVREPYTKTLYTYVLPFEQVQELQVTTANYHTQYNFASGSIDNALARSGANTVHGSLFGFYSTDTWQTRNPINPTNLDPKLHWWQAGGDIGGPIKKDKTFLWGIYEGIVNNSATLGFASVPTQAMRLGDFSGTGATLYNPATGAADGSARAIFPGGSIPFSSLNSLSQTLLGFVPEPNQPGLTNNLVAAVPYNQLNSRAYARLDQRINNDWTAYAAYGLAYIDTSQNSILGQVVGQPMASALRNHYVSASAIGNVKKFQMEFRFGYNRYRNAVNPSNITNPSIQDLLASNGFSTMPTFNITGFGTLGPLANIPNKMYDNTYEGTWNGSYIYGRHDIKLGVTIRQMNAYGWTSFPLSPNGNFWFGPGATSLYPGTAAGTGSTLFQNSVASFLLGAPNASGQFNFADIPTYQQRLYGAFLSDTIRWKKLSVELGVRYDLFSPVQTANANGALIFHPDLNTVTTSNVSGPNVNWDYNNVAPRIGLAYKLQEHTVVRSSFGMEYFPVPFSIAPLNQAGNGTLAGITAGSFQTVPYALPAVATPPIANAGEVTAPNIPLVINNQEATPYIYTYFFMVQHEFPQNTLFDVSYVGNTGKQLPLIQPLNIAPPGTGPAGLPYFDRTASVTNYGQGLTSNYNALQVNLTKRLTKGVMFTAGYAWSKAQDYGTGNPLLNPFNRAANYGVANWDRTQILTISHLFELPFGKGTKRWNTGAVGQILAGWQVNGVFRWYTGMPYNALASSLACNCPGVSEVFAVPSAATGSINGAASFNPALFSGPVPGTFGGFSRNDLRGPDATVYNLSLFKSFKVTERTKIELRGEAYNLMNSAIYNYPPNSVFGTPAFGTADFQNFPAGRTFQIGARVLF